MERNARIAAMMTALESRILLLDGAMGTMIQGYRLSEEDYRGERFADWESDLKGNNDLLSLTRPSVIQEIHRGFLDAGADIIETNTFNSNAPSMADYGMESLVGELNSAAARIARECADQSAQRSGVPRFVAGVIGPTNRTASISPDVNDPGFRNISFDALAETYEEAAVALIEGGVDFLMIETIFDTLNAKAAIFAVEAAFASTGIRLPTPDSSRQSRVPAAWSTMPTTRNSVDLNSACASSRATPASAASRVPKPTTTIMKPSWLTVPYASSSFRSYCRSARQPPTSMVSTPRPMTIGCHTDRSAYPGARRATR